MSNPYVPDTWYVYPTENPREGVASKANYNPSNVAPLIEGFASMLGRTVSEIKFVYPEQEVSHPGDVQYDNNSTKPKSDDLLRYEEAAKRSSILKSFQDNSPAGIEYFN
jgi:hypothetical protein